MFMRSRKSGTPVLCVYIQRDAAFDISLADGIVEIACTVCDVREMAGNLADFLQKLQIHQTDVGNAETFGNTLDMIVFILCETFGKMLFLALGQFDGVWRVLVEQADDRLRHFLQFLMQGDVFSFRFRAETMAGTLQAIHDIADAERKVANAFGVVVAMEEHWNQKRLLIRQLSLHEA